MVEQVFKLSLGDEKAVEKIVFDENVHYLHVRNRHDETLELIVVKAPAPKS